MSGNKLRAEDLYRLCDVEKLPFETTEELEPLTEIVGQPRAVEAVRFGIEMRQAGYHIFGHGPSGTGKRTLVQQFLEEQAAREVGPSSWCYVNNFEQPHKPVALQLPAGKGRQFQKDMEQLIEDVQSALSSAFDSDEYAQRKRMLEQKFTEQQQRALEELEKKARERGLTVQPSPAGLAFVPLVNNEPMSMEQIQHLSEKQREELQSSARELEKEAQKIFQGAPRSKRQLQRQVKALNREIAGQAIDPLVEEVRHQYESIREVDTYLDAVKVDVVDYNEDLLKLYHGKQTLKESREQGGPASMMEPALLRRYRVNVLVDYAQSQTAPVVYEDNPTYQNVIGRIEHMAQMGALMTDFNLIKPGALHRANGGYLILDAYRILMQPLVWEALKRMLGSQEIRIESPAQTLGMLSTISLEPEPIPLHVKVVLMGSSLLHALLWDLDPDFPELFKVQADFDVHMNRSDADQQVYARLVGTLARKEKLRPLDRPAVARVIEHSSRIVGDAQKLSVHMRRVVDLLREADCWASRNGNKSIQTGDIQSAIDGQIFRTDRIRERIQEEIARGTILISTHGTQVGQVNGLAVIPSSDFFFGRPVRITARTRLGKGEVVDIEREVALGGPLHSKGVLILAGFLSGRYARELPLSLSASLVFEQSYAPVGGDSASSAELYALLSAIADLPIKQSLGVTGSVNQHGEIQAIGGVNEKIEGFFDTCHSQGTTGEQGVIIPAANQQHLMLRQDVIEAVKSGEFHIYSVETVDQGVELLTGVSAGERDREGNYPAESVNGKVNARLTALAQKRHMLLSTGERGSSR